MTDFNFSLTLNPFTLGKTMCSVMVGLAEPLLRYNARENTLFFYLIGSTFAGYMFQMSR